MFWSSERERGVTKSEGAQALSVAGSDVRDLEVLRRPSGTLGQGRGILGEAEHATVLKGGSSLPQGPPLNLGATH